MPLHHWNCLLGGALADVPVLMRHQSGIPVFCFRDRLGLPVGWGICASGNSLFLVLGMIPAGVGWWGQGQAADEGINWDTIAWESEAGTGRTWNTISQDQNGSLGLMNASGIS